MRKFENNLQRRIAIEQMIINVFEDEQYNIHSLASKARIVTNEVYGTMCAQIEDSKRKEDTKNGMA